MSLIEIEQVTKTYNPTTIPVEALRGIDLKIEKGEFTAIVGPSGSGKTTLLNIIGGLDQLTNGSIVIDGINISSLTGNALIEFRKNNIGFVFQSYNLVPVLTAKENVEFIMLLQGVPKEERDKRTLDLLAEVGLSDKVDKRPSQLSGGQQQRVAVARALASHPRFVLADEPTANLDSTSTSNLLQIMKDLNEKEGMTFVFSTHDQRVINVARRIITVEDGKVISDEVK
ncbi:MAG: ABC transporter ATP-binding protein [Flavobacteriales bacterium]|nr:ABC transporter ATP-binding protein [Flavobacteriales bacterium]